MAFTVRRLLHRTTQHVKWPTPLKTVIELLARSSVVLSFDRDFFSKKCLISFNAIKPTLHIFLRYACGKKYCLDRYKQFCVDSFIRKKRENEQLFQPLWNLISITFYPVHIISHYFLLKRTMPYKTSLVDKPT